MAQYKSHTDKTLDYIEYTFYRINETKEMFRNACQTDDMIWEGKNNHFNFLKWHIISYYLK